MVFIDLSKDFDTVDRSTLRILLKRYRCPENVVKIIQECHDGGVSIGKSTTDPFESSHGLKQGCVLAPTLFTLFSGSIPVYSVRMPLVQEFSSALDLMENYSKWLDYRQSQQIENFACIRELLFAYAAAIVAHTLEGTR